MTPAKTLLKSIVTLGLTTLLPIFISNAEAAPKEWYCKIEAFTDTYEAIGRTRAEAKLSATRKCTANHHRMHCESVDCEGPDESDVIDDDVYSHYDNQGWICKLKPFTDEYIESANTRAKAKLKVMKKCEKKHSKMFCEKPECERG